jgi:hypothetical protein
MGKTKLATSSWYLQIILHAFQGDEQGGRWNLSKKQQLR